MSKLQDETKSGGWFKYQSEILEKAGWEITWDEGSDIGYVTHAATGKILELIEFDSDSAGQFAQHAVEQVERLSKRS